MKKLTTLAFLAVMTLGVTGANAHMGMRMEGIQNYMYYFGAPCAVAAPCAMEPAPCMVAAPCQPVCCPPVHGIFM